MKMIDKYVYAVVKHLPESARQDVEKELRSNIADMLPEDYTEKDVRAVLLELGNPRDLASQYQDDKRYLIGPALYPHYLLVLKIVAIIVACVLPAVAIITTITESAGGETPRLLLQMLINIIAMCAEAAVHVFTWVTVVFAIMERVNAAQWPASKEKPWSPDDLEEIPTNKKQRIPRSEPIASLIFSVLFLCVLYFAPQLIGVVSTKSLTGGGWQLLPLFNTTVLKGYWPAILGITAILSVLVILKLIYQRWTVPLAVVNGIYQLANVLFVWFFFQDKSLLNTDTLTFLAEKASRSPADLTGIWQNCLLGFTIFLTICFVADTIGGFMKARKTNYS